MCQSGTHKLRLPKSSAGIRSAWEGERLSACVSILSARHACGMRQHLRLQSPAATCCFRTSRRLSSIPLCGSKPRLIERAAMRIRHAMFISRSISCGCANAPEVPVAEYRAGRSARMRSAVLPLASPLAAPAKHYSSSTALDVPLDRRNPANLKARK